MKNYSFLTCGTAETQIGDKLRSSQHLILNARLDSGKCVLSRKMHLLDSALVEIRCMTFVRTRFEAGSLSRPKVHSPIIYNFISSSG